jgi:hypothetical protein
MEQDLEVVDRQPVLGHELGVQLPDDRGVRSEEADPGVELRTA